MQVLRAHGLGACTTPSATTNTADECASGATPSRFQAAHASSCSGLERSPATRSPACATTRLRAGGIRCAADAGNPGLSVVAVFDPWRRLSSPPVRGPRSRFCASRASTASRNGRRLRARRLRARYDVHMSDLQAGRVIWPTSRASPPAAASPTATCSAPGRAGPSRSCSTTRCATNSTAFFAARHSFALGVCNGCQMMAHLAPIIPGAQHWPTFQRNRSEQFEARVVMVEIPQSALDLPRRHGRQPLPVVVSHGEGRAEFADPAAKQGRVLTPCATSTTAARWRQPTRSIPTARPTAWPA
jgi:hypothetical protein